MYPNPAKDIIYLALSNDKQIKRVALYSAKGKPVRLDTYNVNERTVDVSNMESGVYFVAIDFETEMVWKKMIVVR